MSSRLIPAVAIALAVLTGLVASYGIYKRHQAEQTNRAVAIAVEMDVVEALAAGQGKPLPEALRELKLAGVNAVVLSEETIGELANLGQVTFRSTTVESGGERVPIYTLELQNPESIARIRRGLQIRFGNLAGRVAPRGDLVALPPISLGLIRSTAIGLNPDQVRLARENGLQIIGRAGNPTGLSEAGVLGTLDWLKENGASVYLPLGDQVLGRRDSVGAMADGLRSRGMFYASAEFGKIGGDSTVVERIPTNVVRLHTAQAAELDKLPLADAVDRFSKAARERNMRILLLRPVSSSAPQPLGAFGEFASQVGNEVRDDGGIIEQAHGFADPTMPRWYQLLLGALAGAWVLAAAEMVSARRPVLIGGAILALLVAAATLTGTGRMLAALMVSLVAPFVGLLWVDAVRPPRSAPLVRIFAAAIVASLFSLVGGMFVAATMTGLPFLVKAEEFRGIKIAVFLPIVAVGIAYLWRYTDWRGSLRASLTYGSVLLGIGLAAALGILLSRTGNDGVGASGFELLFRNYLDNLLFVRPRTKEFLIGHPMLIVAIGMLYRYSSSPGQSNRPAMMGWVALAMALAAVGQTGIVNTLCHGHVPALLSVARILLGLLLGSIIGMAVWLGVSRVLPKPE